MKRRIDENTKVTLTVGQIKRLVEENAGTSNATTVKELASRIRNELLRCFPRDPDDDGPNALYDPMCDPEDVLREINDIIAPYWWR